MKRRKAEPAEEEEELPRRGPHGDEDAEEEDDGEVDEWPVEEEPVKEKGFLAALHRSARSFQETADGVEDRELWSDGADSDDSDDEPERNRIGNVPLKWYDEEDHVGYDMAGEKVLKTLSTSEID